jgi:tetratricopeptide (TPR) repeat protein
MSQHLDRAWLLYQQSRYDMAEEQLRLALTEDPEDAHALSLLALCLSELERFPEATDAAQRAIGILPDLPFAHFALAQVFHARNRYDEALDAILEAIQLDSEVPMFFALLAAIHLAKRRWSDALQAADEGLQLDPEHVDCTNIRAIALVKLGRRDEAASAIEGALGRSPESARTHANQGWAHLESADHQKALEHFREALRLDPDNDWARQGIVEALKARHFIYALMLRYFLWMSRLSGRAQWGVIIGAFVVNRMLARAAAGSPELAPWLLPVRILLFAAIVLTWTADPLFNLLLRLDRFGRLVLTREQIVASNYLGVCALAALVSLAVGLLRGWGNGVAEAAFVFGFLLMPVSATFQAHIGWPRNVLKIWTLALLLVGVAAIATQAVLSSGGIEEAQRLERLSDGSFLVFVFGTVAFLWGANIIIPQVPKK